MKFPNLKRKQLIPAVTILGVAVIGTIILTASHAATPFLATEPDAGTLTAPASKVTDATASGGSALKFTTATTPTPTPTPTPGGFVPNCIVKPSACGYPDATNTGVPAGTVLTNSGSITVTTAGAVIQNLSITGGGQIVVKANNVTIKNTKIVGCTYYPIEYDDAYSGLVVQDTEIGSTCADGTAAMSFGNYTARRVNAYGSADGFKANANATIEDSYIHDLAVTANSHNDGIQSTGGNNVTLRHNTCDIGSAGVCTQFGSSNSGWLITNNLIRASGWAFNGSTGTTGNTFTNNRFVRLSGWYGPISVGSNNTITGNYYDDNNASAN